MLGNARVQLDLLNGAERIFTFQVKGRGYNHIENQIAEFAASKKFRYGNKVKLLKWEVKFIED